MKKSFIVLFATVVLAVPVISFAAEAADTGRENISIEEQKKFQKPKSCFRWERERGGFRRIYEGRSKSLSENTHPMVVTVSDDGTVILQHGDKTYIIESDR